MDILKMKPELWYDSELHYVGRSRYGLGLGNPWAVPTGTGSADRQVKYWVNSKADALANYEAWFIGKLIKNYTSGLGYIGLEPWEKSYLSGAIILSRSIRQGLIKRLGCFCVNLVNYVPSEDVPAQCHAEILYKGCLLINEFEAKSC